MKPFFLSIRSVFIGGATSLAALIGVAALSLVVAGLAQTPPDDPFARVTEGPAAAERAPSLAAVWVDYDGDGLLDLFVANHPGSNSLYHNEGNGVFRKVTTGPVALDTASSTVGAWADYNNDGLLDLFVAHNGVANRLYRATADGGFTKVASGPVVSPVSFFIGSAWGDYDRDGNVDLFVANLYGANFLYHNNGDGTFTQVTSGGVVTDLGDSVGAAWGDYDNDGYLDLFVANGGNQPNLLYHNNRDGTFTRVTAGAIAKDTGYSTGCAWADYDNDGWLDLFVANRMGPCFLYHNNRDGTFRKVTDAAPVTDAASANGCTWGDYDNDGYLDLFVTNWEGTSNVLYHNNGDGTFRKVTESQVSNERQGSVGCSWGDYDNDGFLDLVVANWNGQGNLLYRNKGNANHWLKVKCVGLLSNRSGIGARVWVTAGGVTQSARQMREINGGSGWGDQTLQAHFGLSAATKVDAVQVLWPSGVVQEYADVAADQTLVVTESDLPGPPRIVVQPRGQAVTAGASVVLSVLATGTRPLGFQWTLNGVAVPDATAAVFVLASARIEDSGNYAVTVSNTEGSVTSEIVVLSVTPGPEPPKITKQPESQSVVAGGTVTFTVEVTGAQPLEYEWRRNALVVTGATGPTLVINNVQNGDAGLYTLKVTNEGGSASSDAATLTVTPAPVRPAITAQPQGQTVAVGRLVTLSVTATGTEPLNYQWYRNGLAVTGSSSATLTLENVQLAHAGAYTVRVSNKAGSLMSLAAQLKVVEALQPPAITMAPLSQVVALGRDAVLTVTATGSAPLAYQWRLNGAVLPGGITAELRIETVLAAHAGTYTVTVSNGTGSVTSFGAVLVVLTGEAGGTINFDNRVGDIDAPVFDADGVIPLTGPAYLAQLYGGPDGSALAPIGAAVPFRTGIGAGYFYAGGTSLRVITSVAPGAVAAVEARVWESAGGPTYEQALAVGAKTGHSARLRITTGGAGDPPGFPADLTGLTSFAVAADQVPPEVSIASPVTGTIADERAVLSGVVADNSGVVRAAWAQDGQPMGALSVVAGRFEVSGLRLHRGPNVFRVVATDGSGNTAAAEATVTWAPLRTLAVRDATDQQEGRRVSFPLELASGGEVGGLTFRLRYDPEWLTDPAIAWSEVLAGASSQVNYDAPGEVRATISFPATVIPAGTQRLGEVSFRARSVPARTQTVVTPEVLDVADAQGNQFQFGTDVAAGGVSLAPRRVVGDGNGNDRLDIGDATIIQRLLARLETPRAWDIGANDLNESRELDSGDVVRVLRVVVGLDPQPPAGGGGGGQGGGGRVGLAGPPTPTPSVAAALLMADRLRAGPGETITVQVVLRNVAAKLSGARFSLEYPAAALRLVDARSVRSGPLVPANAATAWNVGPSYEAQSGHLSAAMSTAAAWAAANGVLAEVSFQVQPGAASEFGWAVTLGEVEITSGNGYDVAQLGGAALRLNPRPPQVAGGVRLEAAGLRFSVVGEMDVSYAIEVSNDLKSWRPLQTLLNRAGVFEVLDPDAGRDTSRFYRVREAQ